MVGGLLQIALDDFSVLAVEVEPVEKVLHVLGGLLAVKLTEEFTQRPLNATLVAIAAALCAAAKVDFGLVGRRVVHSTIMG